MYGYQLISQCLGHTAQLGLAAGVGADLPAASKVPCVAYAPWLSHGEVHASSGSSMT